MSDPKKTSRGYVVEHKESGVRYAVSPGNFNEKIHTKVRNLKPGETVLGYAPRAKPKRSAAQDVAVADVTPPVTNEPLK